MFVNNVCILVLTKILIIIQGFEGGQGWANAILYIFLSKDMRSRLFNLLFRRRAVDASHLFTPTIGVTAPHNSAPSNTYYSSPISHYETLTN